MKDSIIKKIESYRKSNDKRPIVVDVSTLDDLHYIKQIYATLLHKDVLDLVKIGSELPLISDIHEFMGECTEDTVLLTGIGSYLKLLGDNELNCQINSILKTSYRSKFIIITYQCAKYFKSFDARIKYKILIVEPDKEETIPCSIVLIPSKFKTYVSAENGLINAIKKLEIKENETIYATASYKFDNFKNSLIRIQECKSPYDLICLKDNLLKNITKSLGTDEQWGDLLEKLQNNSVIDTIKEYIKINNIDSCIENWNEMDHFQQWLTFIYLKLVHVNIDNWSINYAINKSSKLDDFIFNIYYSLSYCDYKETGFFEKYTQWKNIIKKINEESILYIYCKYIQVKNEFSLYYLTDNTETERKTIIQIIDRYKDSISKKKLTEILSRTYPNLYYYLTEYNYGDDFLNKYFNEYKYLKVLNTLTPEFKNVVDQEAVDRSFKKRLMCRSEVLNDIDYTDTIVYFVDALGVEFLSFIQKMCEQRDLSFNATICRANLPSITSKNTEFREFFKQKGVEVLDEKELDDLKHSGKDDYDFDKNKLPYHIIEEFNVINKCLDNINKKIKTQTIKKAVIVSDHGATRLAILNTDVVREDLESVGEHGGRVCKVIPNMKKIPNAIIENDCCVLADYNAFKGGRIGKVEMHGGATLEEVTVPIIEISKRGLKINITVITKILKASYKTNAILQFFSSVKLNNVNIKINGKSYIAETSDNFYFKVELDDIKKSGDYSFEVWSNNNLVSDNNEFRLESAMVKEVDIWG